jgi:hypothetical protein
MLCAINTQYTLCPTVLLSVKFLFSSVILSILVFLQGRVEIISSTRDSRVFCFSFCARVAFALVQQSQRNKPKNMDIGQGAQLRTVQCSETVTEQTFKLLSVARAYIKQPKIYFSKNLNYILAFLLYLCLIFWLSCTERNLRVLV